MKDIPKRFPEYSIMHKTILNQIKKLEKEDETLEVKNKNIRVRIKKNRGYVSRKIFWKGKLIIYDHRHSRMKDHFLYETSTLQPSRHEF